MGDYSPYGPQDGGLKNAYYANDDTTCPGNWYNSPIIVGKCETCSTWYGSQKQQEFCLLLTQWTSCINNCVSRSSCSYYTCEKNGGRCYIHCGIDDVTGTFVEDPHMTDFYGRQIDIKVNQPGYYNIIDDPLGEEKLIFNKRIYIKKLKSVAGRIGDWIDGSFIKFKEAIVLEDNNNTNNENKKEGRFHQNSYTIGHHKNIFWMAKYKKKNNIILFVMLTIIIYNNSKIIKKLIIIIMV